MLWRSLHNAHWIFMQPFSCRYYKRSARLFIGSVCHWSSLLAKQWVHFYRELFNSLCFQKLLPTPKRHLHNALHCKYSVHCARHSLCDDKIRCLNHTIYVTDDFNMVENRWKQINYDCDRRKWSSRFDKYRRNNVRWNVNSFVCATISKLICISK